MRKKGFTLAELLIVVAIIGVLVAISIPMFGGLLEKKREEHDLSNVRSKYASVMAFVMSEEYEGQPVIEEVQLAQTSYDWQLEDNSELAIGDLKIGDTYWIGAPIAKGICQVIYDGKEDQMVVVWDGDYTPSARPEKPEFPSNPGGTDPGTDPDEDPDHNDDPDLSDLSGRNYEAFYDKTHQEGNYISLPDGKVTGITVEAGKIYKYEGKTYICTNTTTADQYWDINPAKGMDIFQEIVVRDKGFLFTEDNITYENDPSGHLYYTETGSTMITGGGVYCDKNGECWYLKYGEYGWLQAPSSYGNPSDGNWIKVDGITLSDLQSK